MPVKSDYSDRFLGTPASNDFARDVQRDYIIKDDTSEQSFSLALGELDGPYFKELVHTDDAQDPRPPKPPKLRSHNRIYKAKAFLQEAVTKFIASEPPQAPLKMLKSLSQTITSDLVVSPISVRDQKEAFRLFETLNDRGLRLSAPDPLLNYLMGAATQVSDRQTIRESWNEMLERLGRRDISRFLRHLWVSQHGELTKTDLFTAPSGEVQKDGATPVEFAKACAAECHNYLDLLQVDDQKIGSAVRYVRSLVRTLDMQVAMPLMLSCYKRMTEHEFRSVVQLILVFVSRYSLIAEMNSAGLETVLFDLAKMARQELTSISPW